ncbi:MAG: WD40 repeat domain-containing protein, partial [bacterium]
MSDFPYPGLRPFRQDETDIFFGREGQVDQLLERLEKSRFLAVLGPSGCGKSSLLNAGMLASLEIGFMASAGAQWRTATMKPGNSPIRELARALLKDESLGPEWGEYRENVAYLQAVLRRGPLGLVEALKETPLPKGTNVLILVDQFEEIFRYRQQGSADEAEAFVSLLLNSARQREVPVYVVIAMRTDFLGDCSLLSGLPEAINEGQFLIPRLDREQSRAAIEGPAGVFQGEIEPALVNRLLNDMQKDPDQLPLMQHALMRMWTLALARGAASPTLTSGDYEAIGGLEKALSNHADEAFDELEERQKPIAETLFRSLTERSITRRDTRRPTRLSKVAAITGVDPEEVAKVVEVFRQPGRSFLTPSVREPLLPETIIDISHESLIRQWERLNGWVEAEAVSAGEYYRLEQTAHLWKEGVAELWGGLDLQNALAWKDRQHPTREWANRYGTDFDLVMEFLTKSQNHWEEEKKRKKESAQRELKLKQAKKRMALTLVGLVIALCLVFWALSEREKARKAEDFICLHLFKSYLKQASLLAENDNYEHARETLRSSRTLDPQIQHIQPELLLSRKLLDWFVNTKGGKAARTYQLRDDRHLGDIRLYDVAVSPDGHLLAAIGEEGTVALFDLDSARVVGRWQVSSAETKDAFRIWGSIAFHPDGKRLITAGDGRGIVLLSVPDGKKLDVWQTRGKIWDLALSPDGKWLATGGTDPNVTIRDVETGKVIRILEGHHNEINGLSFSPDGRFLASASADQNAIIWEWDLKKWKCRHVLCGHTDEVAEVVFSPDSRILATGGEDKNILLWDVESGRQKGILQGHSNEVYGLAFINHRYLASASRDRTVRIWDVDLSLRQDHLSIPVWVLQGHRAFINRLTAFGNQLFSAGDDHKVLRWDIPSKIMPEDIKMLDFSGDGRGYEPRSCAIAPDGSALAVQFSSGRLRLYALPDTRLLWESPGVRTKRRKEEESPAREPETEEPGAEVISRLIFSSDGQSLALANYDDPNISIWQARSGRLMRIFKGHKGGVLGLAFSPDGRLLATAGLDGKIGIFERDKENGRFYSAHERAVFSVAFSRDCRQLLSAGEDGTARLWDLKTWSSGPILRQVFPVSEDRIYWAAFSPDESKIGLVGRDTMVHILRASDGRKERILPGHESSIYRIAFSPDGGQVVTVSKDATLRLWDLENEEELFALRL